MYRCIYIYIYTSASAQLHDEMQVMANPIRFVRAHDVGVVQAPQQVDLVAEGVQDAFLLAPLGYAAHKEGLTSKPATVRIGAGRNQTGERGGGRRGGATWTLDTTTLHENLMGLLTSETTFLITRDDSAHNNFGSHAEDYVAHAHLNHD